MGDHGHGSGVRSAGFCPDCGKVRFLNRKDARTIARRRNHTVNAYRCGGYWHLGHLPALVKAGILGRDDIRPA